MDIILLKDYDGLGESGDVVAVKPGFARNKLIPEGIALRASKRIMAIAEERKMVAKNRQKRELQDHHHWSCNNWSLVRKDDQTPQLKRVYLHHSTRCGP